MPAASLIRMISSPADGLLVVPLVTVPVMVAANDAAVKSRIAVTRRPAIVHPRALKRCLISTHLRGAEAPLFHENARFGDLSEFMSSDSLSHSSCRFRRRRS